MSALHYPDLGAPPRGWTGARQGAAIRLIPPGATLDASATSMFVSPLVPQSRQLPPPAVVIAQTLAAEQASGGVDLIAQTDPAAVVAVSGLAGVRVEATVRVRATGQLQRRVYTMYADLAWLYGLHLVADEAGYQAHRAAYDAVVASMKPYPAA